MSVASGSLNGENTTSDVKEGYIEGTTAKIENEDVLLLGGLLVKTVSNGGRGGLVDDTEDLETSNSTSVLGGKTLRVIEVSGDARKDSS